MTAFSRYLGYRLKQSTLRTIVFTLISLVITLGVVDDCLSVRDEIYRSSGIYILAVILSVFCTLIPFLELSGFKNRRNLDTLYFFPIERPKMALAHYLSCLIQVVFIYSVCFFALWAVLAISTDIFSLGYMVLYYVFSLLIGIMMLSIFSFILTESNSIVDGAIFCALWAFVLYLAIWVARTEILRPLLKDTSLWSTSSGIASWGMVYAPINNLTVIFEDLIEVNRRNLEYHFTHASATEYLNQIYMFFIWGAIGIAATVGYFVSFVKKNAHEAGEISSSFFGYKALIPAYGYMLIMANRRVDIVTFVIFALMVVGYAIYRRGFKLKKVDIAFIAGGIVPAVLTYLINN